MTNKNEVGGGEPPQDLIVQDIIGLFENKYLWGKVSQLGEITIPKALQQANLKLIKLVTLGEKNIESWRQGKYYSFDDPELQSHIADGRNYGVLCDSLVVLEADPDKVNIDALPETFTVRTPKSMNYYFICPEMDRNIEVPDPTRQRRNLIEIKAKDQFVVGPNCRIWEGNEETGEVDIKYWTVEKDHEIATVSKEQLEAFCSTPWTVNAPKKAPSGLQIVDGKTELPKGDYKVGEILRVAEGIRVKIERVDSEKAYAYVMEPEFNKIPTFMAQKKQFCLRVGKVPYIMDGSSFTSNNWSKNRKGWLTLYNAMEIVSKRPNYKIGYLNARGDPQIVGGDIDGCVAPSTGEVSAFAKWVIQKVKPFYIEVSPSGTGLRFFCLGDLGRESFSKLGDQDLSEEMKKDISTFKEGAKFNSLELYTANRHLSLTGEFLGGWEPTDRTDEVREIVGELEPEPKAEIKIEGQKTTPMGRRGLPKLDILEVARCEGFIATEKTESEVLGYFPEYGSTTGRNIAINPSKGTFCNFHNGAKTGGDVWVLLAYLSGASGWEANGKNLLDNPRVREATKEYVIEHGYAKREDFTEHWGITYEDISKLDRKGESLILSVTKAAEAILKKMPLIMEIGDDSTIWWFDGEIYRPDGEAEIDALLCSLAKDQVTNQALNEVLRRVRYGLKKGSQVKINPYPYLLGVENGVVDLRTGELIDCKPEFYITAKIPIEYDPAAKCPQFFDYLEGITPNVIDRLTLIDYGATLAIREPMPFLLFLLGLGRNGKGVYENILYKLYGEDKFSETKIDELGDNRFAAGNLKDKWGLIITESGVNRGKNIIDTRMLKKISGGDFLDSDRKNKSRIRFRAYCKPIIDSNIMPAIDDRSRGIEERFCKISLPYSFVTNPKEDRPEEKKKDPEMYQKTTTPKELQGILNVFVERVKEILKTKEIIRRDPEKTFEEYHDQSASVNAFLDMFCDYDSDSFSLCPFSSLDIYQAFDEWSSIKVAAKVSEKRFLNALKRYCDQNEPARRIDINSGKKNRYYRGLTFYHEVFEEYMEREKKKIGQKNYISVEESEYGDVWFNLAEKFGNRDKNLRMEEEKKIQEKMVEEYAELLRWKFAVENKGEMDEVLRVTYSSLQKAEVGSNEIILYDDKPVNSIAVEVKEAEAKREEHEKHFNEVAERIVGN